MSAARLVVRSLSLSRSTSRPRSCSSLPVSTRSISCTHPFPITRLSSRSFSTATASHVLVLADHNNTKITDATFHAISAASQLKPSKLTVLVAGHQAQEAVKQVSSISGVTSVLHADHAAYEHALAENVAHLLVTLQKKNNYSHIVTAGTASGKNIIPRAAIQLDVQPIGDVIEIQSPDTFVRPIYAGNALSTVQSSDSVKMMTIRQTAFAKATPGSSSAPVETESISNPDVGLTKWVADELSISARPELATARVVISGGRGMKSGENFKMLEELADTLGGAVGASRAAVDAGFVPNDYQVGQTGKVVAPDLYVAVGISGAIQHLAGMKDSKVIVAINKDAEAPIFQVADYGLVTDLFKAVPELTTAIKTAKSK